MKKKTTVATSATNPFKDFFKKLPKKAIVLGIKCYRNEKQSKLTICYQTAGGLVTTKKISSFT